MPREIDKFLARKPPPIPRPAGKPPPLPVVKPIPREETLPGQGFDVTFESEASPREAATRSPTTPFPEPLPDQPESLPRGHVLATDRNWPPDEKPPGQRSVSPIPWDARASSPELAREVARHGDRLVRAPESAPGSSVAPGPITSKGLFVSWAAMKKAAPWVLAVLGLGGGGGTGYFVGLRAARAEVAALQESALAHEKRIARREAAAAILSKDVDAIDDSLKSEAQERRVDVGALRKEMKAIRESQPTIEGLPKR